MFKVQENGDGSTSIFCNNTGTLICTIRSQQRNMGYGCRPVNVVEPSPQPRSHLYNLDLKSECSSDDDEKQSSRKRVCLSPLPEEPKEDFYDDCITPEEFARCLNLVPTEKFKDTPIDQLNSTFPLRHHSRTKSAQISEDLYDLKLFDDLPLTSSLGVKLLKLNPKKNFISDESIAQKIKNYDSFCRFQLNTPTMCSNFPKLRCREKKDYPVYVSQKISKNGRTHTYTFNRKQRFEKMLTLKTGLSARSRRILQEQCKKRLAVCLKRLTEREIQVWLSKKSSIVRPITLDCIRDEPVLICSDSETTVVEDSAVPYVISDSSDADTSPTSSNDSDYSPGSASLQNKNLSFKGVLNKSVFLSPTKSVKYLSPSKSLKCLSPNKSLKCLSPTKSLKCLSSPIRNRKKHCSKNFPCGSLNYKDCFVKVNNVLKRVCKYLGDYYIHGTQIRIPFLSGYLKSLDPKCFDMNSILDNDAYLKRPTSSLVFNANLKPNSCHDHAYHLPFPETLLKKKSTPYCLNHKSSKTKGNAKDVFKVSNQVKNKPNILSKLNSVKNSLNSPRDGLSMIPIIDLTDSPPKLQNKSTSKWIFQCYGCGFKKVFTDESSVKTAGIEHLRQFHCVVEPESFLTPSSSANGVVVLEAFPGYKGSFK